MIAVVRDPIDRAYSNWTHLWCDGLETVGDFRAACDARAGQDRAGATRRSGGTSRPGLYGSQLEHLLSIFPREQVHVLRYRQLIDDPAGTLDDICDFLGVSRGVVSTVPHSNLSSWAPDTRANARGAAG